MKNKRGLFWIITGLLLIVAALSLTAFNLILEHRAGAAAEDALTQLEAQILTHPVEQSLPVIENPSEIPAIPTEPVSPEETEIPDFILNPEMEMPVKNLNGIDYIGILQIPALELTLPICSQWSYTLLQSAPCRYEGTAYQNDLILMAHNYDSHFGRLKELDMGEMIFFTDVDENTFIYQVSARETLMPTAVEEMSGGDWPLTLFTCTLGGANRVTVRCELVGVN